MKISHNVLALVACAIAHSPVMASPNDETSVDQYCRSVSFGFADTYRFLGHKPNSGEKFDKAISDIEKTCRNSPSPSPIPKKSMTPQQIAAISCMGFAEGAYIAHLLGKPDPSYATLSKHRTIAAEACLTNPKRFQDDIFRKGPSFVLSQRY